MAIFRTSKIPLITLVQLSQKIVWTNFDAAQTKTVGGVRKGRFFTFCDFVKKKCQRANGRGLCQDIQLDPGNVWM